MWRVAVALLLLQLALRAQGTPCPATRYLVVGKLKLRTFIGDCSDTIVTHCWATVQVRYCKDRNKTEGTDGSIAVVPTYMPYFAATEENDTMGTLVPCPTAVGEVRASRAQGVIVDDAGNQADFALFSSSSAGEMILTTGGEECLYYYTLEKSTSDILDTKPQQYGQSSAQHAVRGDVLAVVVTALVGLAILL